MLIEMLYVCVVHSVYYELEGANYAIVFSTITVLLLKIDRNLVSKFLVCTFFVRSQLYHF